MSTSTDKTDDKHIKHQSQQSKSILFRQLTFYTFFFTLLFDTYFSNAKVLEHLTVWSWILHTIYFQLSLNSNCHISTKSIQIFHGPSFCGAHALAAMYVWTLTINPQMEFDLAPEGRPSWLIYTRGVWLHFLPILVHYYDIYHIDSLTINKMIFYNVYYHVGKSWLFQFWACVGGYFAMGLTWEQVNGDAAGTYNVTIVSAETYVVVSKIIGVLACVLSFWFVFRPKVICVNTSIQ